ncbi:hypothetical protein DBR17_15780 [Sphingomonas sp. HMWF008]|nr:hypothetical protein DBR17_15780 [Sphingomonas sp. HMWF008]
MAPIALDFTHTIEPHGAATQLRVDLGPDRQAELMLLRSAILRAEGTAGLVANFLDPASADPNGNREWLFAQAGLDRPVLSDGTSFGLPVPIQPVLPSLFREMALAGGRFGYRLRLRQAGPVLWAARECAAALARATIGTGAITRLAAPLRSGIELAGRRGWVANEYLMVHRGSAEACGDLIERDLCRHLANCCPGVRPDAMTIEWSHTTVPPGRFGSRDVQEIIGERRDDAYLSLAVTTALAAAADAAGRLPPLQDEVSGRPSPPPPPPVTGPFAFVSYAHRDAARVTAMVAGLRARGLSVWYDEGIKGGDLWDECLEQRIRDAALFIACLSPAFEVSRYCRREIKFADMLGTPILPLSEASREWGKGLALMFSERQILLAVMPHSLDDVAQRALALAPGCRSAAGQ